MIMVYTLKNEFLTVELSSIGAEVISVKDGFGCEYIWQGDERYWKGQAPLLFPICGRLFEGKYTLGGKEYSMTNHGFARRLQFCAEAVGETAIRFTAAQNEDTLAVYPFDFSLTVEYRLEGKRLFGGICVTNTGKELMPFTVGLHPGFNVPLDKGSFEDWYIEFEQPCSPDRIMMSDTCFLTGKNEAFYLDGEKYLPLKHGLFDNDAIFLARNSTEISLRSKKSDRYVTVEADGFPYVGFWHKPCSDAPYVCIEPWCGLPAYDGEIDELSKKRDMFRIASGEKKELTYTIIFG